MSQIKVEFYRHENFVCGRVLEMPEEIRGKVIISDGAYGIFSDEGPSLDGRCLYLRGKNKYSDSEWFSCTYCDNDTAERIVQTFQNLIDKWNKEHREILTEEEKAYLSAVIKPFKNRVKNFARRNWGANLSYIIMYYDINEADDFSLFPTFKNGTMYNGMETDRKYTLKELGLE